MALSWTRWMTLISVGVGTVLAWTLTPLYAGSPTQVRIIRPPDDRMDYGDVSSELQAVGDAVCAFVMNEDLVDNGDGTFQLAEGTLSLADNFDLPLCDGEPFGNQPTAAFCTASLIAPDVVVTAGHCFVNDDNEFSLEFDSFYFVFDYRVDADGNMPSTFTVDQVYRGAETVDRFFDPDSEANDWAIVRLERATIGRTPLTVRSSGEPAVGQDIMTIGFGMGLPMKFSGNATIQELNVDGFTANLDIIGGNSGGPVIDAATRTLEGVISGDAAIEDYQDDGACVFATRCPEDPGCLDDDGAEIFTLVGGVTLPDFQRTIHSVVQTDSDDHCPDDPTKTEPGVCGCGEPDVDADADGVMDCDDECPDSEAAAVVDVYGCSEEDDIFVDDDDQPLDDDQDIEDIDGSANVDVAPPPAGPCGAMGMIMLPLMILSLAGMKRSRSFAGL